MRASASAGAPASFPIGVIGERVDLTYDYEYLGAGPETLGGLQGRSSSAQAPSVRSGWSGRARWRGPTAPRSCGARREGGASTVGAVKDGWNGFSVLHTAASRVGALDIGFVPAAGRPPRRPRWPKAGALDVVFLLGADEIEVAPGAFVVYIGTHGDRGAHRADVILPGAAYTEKSGIYVNTEGRVQMAARAAFPPGDAREDWAILRALSDVLGAQAALQLARRQLRAALFKAHPHLQRIDQHRARQSGRHREARRPRRHAGQGAVPVADRGFLSDQPDRAGLRRHGRVLGAGDGPAALTAAE